MTFLSCYQPRATMWMVKVESLEINVGNPYAPQRVTIGEVSQTGGVSESVERLEIIVWNKMSEG